MDRVFRPDVEGLRAVAIATVIFCHYGVPGFTGGFVGVDVFFVISGFVICGVLLREREASDETSMSNFYARRFRRILPASMLVLLVTVVSTYLAVGSVIGKATANDARWVVVFLSNVHFADPHSNPLSPLRNYWSLAVEEQFYLVFPTLFLLIASARRGPALRIRLTGVLVLVIGLSLVLSIVQSASDPVWAYVSPFTRAWELAFGALIAAATPLFIDLAPLAARLTSWLGLGIVVLSATLLIGVADYPGWKVIFPVLGAGLVIVGGCSNPSFGAEMVLGHGIAKWVGRHSYSLYLWHWPVLIVLAASGAISGTWSIRGVALALTVVASVATFRFVENPVRRTRFGAVPTILAGLAVSVVVLVGLSIAISV